MNNNENMDIKMNSLFTSLSMINAFSFRKNYYDSEGARFLGRFASEAPTRDLMNTVGEKGQMMDQFVVLTSKDCGTKKVVSKVDQEYIYQENGEMTTLEYYRQCIEEEMHVILEKCDNPSIKGQLLKKLSAYGDIENIDSCIHQYVEAAVHPIQVSNDPMLSEVQSGLESCGLADANVYLDLTGGSRLSGIIMALFIRAYSHSGAKIKKVVYGSNMSAGVNNRIVDWTQDFRAFGILEETVKGAKGNIERAFKEAGLEVVHQDTTELDDMLMDEQRNTGIRNTKQKEADIQKFEKKEKELASKKDLASANKRKEIAKTKQDIMSSPLEKKLDDDAQIKVFYESMVKNICDMGIVVIDESQKSNQSKKSKDKQITEVKACIEGIGMYYYGNEGMNNFYESKGKKIVHRNGVIPFTRNCIIRELRNYILSSPVKSFEAKLDVDNKFYQNFNTDLPYRNSGNLNQTRQFLQYKQDRNMQLAIDDNARKISLDEALEEYDKYKILYMNYGFPFAFIDKNRKSHQDVRQYYIDRTMELMMKLEDMKRHDLKAYQAYLDELLDDKNPTLEMEIPLMIECNSLHVNPDIIWEYEGQKKDSTMIVRQVMAQMEQVRAARNVLSHNKFEDPKMKNKVIREAAEKVRIWNQEYSKLNGYLSSQK